MTETIESLRGDLAEAGMDPDQVRRDGDAGSWDEGAYVCEVLAEGVVLRQLGRTQDGDRVEAFNTEADAVAELRRRLIQPSRVIDDDERAAIRRRMQRRAKETVMRRGAGVVDDELVEVAEHLVARGLGEGYDFFVRGRPVPSGLSSEYIGLERRDDGSYRVWYLGDWGTPRPLVETDDWPVARTRFVEEAVRLARGRHGGRTILDDPGETPRRWWQRRRGVTRGVRRPPCRPARARRSSGRASCPASSRSR